MDKAFLRFFHVCKVVILMPEQAPSDSIALNYLRSAYGLLYLLVFLGEWISRPGIRNERLQHRPRQRVLAGIHPCLSVFASADGDG